MKIQIKYVPFVIAGSCMALSSIVSFLANHLPGDTEAENIMLALQRPLEVVSTLCFLASVAIFIFFSAKKQMEQYRPNEREPLPFFRRNDPEDDPGCEKNADLGDAKNIGTFRALLRIIRNEMRHEDGTLCTTREIFPSVLMLLVFIGVAVFAFFGNLYPLFIWVTAPLVFALFHWLWKKW